MEIKGNGTGYFDPMCKMFRGVEVERNVVYSTVCPNTQRRIVVIPLKAFIMVKYQIEEHLRQEDDALVLFERYTPGTGSAEVLIEQLTQSNNANTGATLKLANVLSVVIDFM